MEEFEHVCVDCCEGCEIVYNDKVTEHYEQFGNKFSVEYGGDYVSECCQSDYIEI
jgi:hypothetical protein